ncbi:type II 3-dehydroquinate dehydratase [Haliovirga abyssi]|uniref:3-dehydroquinate dehydratase n=1 Tax=Haliovirga abyssi TaxID=2996794 RepID=A0AAU9DIA4_9FUSO|nr:type II 3-dehydroquinate dehydratase [Haliovirga abyssi]BDU50489.1 3-dehydroquinate dehydratase [Haliovirga abyssi]
MKVLVIHGVNLNMLGKREPGIYGNKNFDDINNIIKNKAKRENIDIEIYQSNHEGEIVDKIQEAYDNAVDYIIINPAAFTHYSIAIRDALAAVNIPFVEVHISNVYKREKFRHKSVTAPIAIGQITGFSYYGYLMAIDYLKYRENGE